MGKDKRGRLWAFVVYPDSAPENWVELLQQSGLQCAISPLHDRDENADGEEKKPHWHVIAVWHNGSATYSMAKALTDSLNAPIPQLLASVRGYYRYLTHADNPEKVQYSEKDIRTLNGFNIADFVELTKTEVAEIKKRLQRIIIDGDILEYSDLMDLILDSDMVNEYEVASNNTLFFNSYIRSRRFKREREDAKV